MDNLKTMISILCDMVEQLADETDADLDTSAYNVKVMPEGRVVASIPFSQVIARARGAIE